MSSESTPLTPVKGDTDTAAVASVKEAAAQSIEFLDFNLSKSYEAWQETQKSHAKAFISYIFFLVLTAVLLWGEGLEDRINVPVLSLSIDRRFASIWSLVLNSINLYWLSTTAFYSRLITVKVEELLRKRYGRGAVAWQMEYPSPFRTIVGLLPALVYSKKRGFLVPAAFLLLSLIAFYTVSFFVLPTLFVWKAASVFGYGTFAKGAILVFAILFIAPTIFLTFYRRMQAVEKRLQKGMEIRSVKEFNFEIDAEAKKKCFELYGLNCYVCESDFKEVYGKSSEKFMQAHLIKPWSEIGELERLSPAEHLRPVCPNCHSIIHLENPPLSFDAVRAMLQGNTGKQPLREQALTDR